MSQPGEPRPKRPARRWFQYSLRTLLGVVTLAVGLTMGWRSYIEPYQRQRRTLQLIEQLGGTYQTAEAPRWLRRLNGEDFQNITVVNLADCDRPDDYIDAVAALPALETLVVGGLAFTDDHLRRLGRSATLRNLVLDSTGVSDEAIAKLARYF